MIINDSISVCNENYEDTRTYFLEQDDSIDAMPTIYFITPTYPRREQIPELTRLGQTLMHIPKLHWIVADDHDSCNSFLTNLLNRFGTYSILSLLFFVFCLQ